MTKHKVDKDLGRFAKVEAALGNQRSSWVNLSIAGAFLVGVLLFAMATQGGTNASMFIIAAGVIGGYMAINIGANDVANNIGPAVGSKALTMVGALVIAAIFEAAGALIAGGDVVSTIRKGIIDPAGMTDMMTFVWVMMSALLAAALWLNLATWIGAPVSTTHSIVGGIAGAGIAAAGAGVVNWKIMSGIAASWVISPILGGIIAAIFLAFIEKNVLNKKDKLAAANRWVPILVGVMAGAFSMYLVMKGLKKLWKPDLATLWMIGIGTFALVAVVTRPMVTRASAKLENRKKSVSMLFTIPLIFSAALLSFAHGANDVANAVGPLAAIVGVLEAGSMETGKVAIPLWVMLIGAVGIGVGLMLFGPKLIKTVGTQITKLNQVRAFCVALSAAITVITASWLGMPVSSTHIAVGAVFGVGFLREYLANRTSAEFKLATFTAPETSEDTDKLYKKIKKNEKRKLVRRRHLVGIAAAWIITVPAAGFLSAALYAIFTSF